MSAVEASSIPEHDQNPQHEGVNAVAPEQQNEQARVKVEVPDSQSATSVASFFDQKPKDESLKILESDNEEVRSLKSSYNVLHSEVATLRALLKEQQNKSDPRPNFGRLRTAGFANNKPNLNAPITRANQRVLGATTLRRRQLLQEKLSTVKNQLAQWINGLLNYTNPEDQDPDRRPLTADTLLERFATGIVLCQLAIRISPSASMSIRRINTQAKPYSILAHENVKYFLAACVSFGVVRHELFEPNSLLNTNPENRNEREVVFSILSLSRVALRRFNIQPPSMVMHENLIDQLGEHDSSMKLDSPSEGADSTGLTRADNEKIKAAVEAFCRTNEIEHAPNSTGRRGEYSFVDGTTAHVRLFEAPNLDPESTEGETVETLLVRFGNTWEDMLTFIGEHSNPNDPNILRAKAGGGPLGISQRMTKQQGAELAAKEVAKKALEQALQEINPVALNIDVTTVLEEEVALYEAATRELNLLKTQYNELLAEKNQLEAELKESKETIVVLEKDLGESKETIVVLEKNVADLQHRVDEYAEEAKAEKERNKAAEEAIASSNASIEDVKAQLVQAVSRSTKAEEKIEKLEAEKKAAEERIAKLEEEKKIVEQERLEEEAAALSSNVEADEDELIENSINQAIKDTLDNDDKHTMAIMNSKFDFDHMQDLLQRQKAGEKLTTEERRQLNKYNAKREFFFLTALSVKMSHKLRDEIDSTADSEVMWEDCCRQHISFHKFHRWISKEITMRVLAKDALATRGAGVTLRTFRAQQTDVMQNRKLTKPEDEEL